MKLKKRILLLANILFLLIIFYLITLNQPSSVLAAISCRKQGESCMPGYQSLKCCTGLSCVNYICVTPTINPLPSTLPTVPSSVTITSSPIIPTNIASCEKKSQGDADCNGVIDGQDFVIWKTEFLGSVFPSPTFGVSPTSSQSQPSPTTILSSPTPTESCANRGESCANKKCCLGLTCKSVTYGNYTIKICK